MGASDGELVSMVMGHSVALVGTGLAVGIAGAPLLGGTLSSLVYGLRAWGPISIGVTVVTLGAVGMLAAWIPARRAVRIDPREALRAD